MRNVTRHRWAIAALMLFLTFGLIASCDQRDDGSRSAFRVVADSIDAFCPGYSGIPHSDGKPDSIKRIVVFGNALMEGTVLPTELVPCLPVYIRVSQVDLKNSLEVVKRRVDLFFWQHFIALNWPVQIEQDTIVVARNLHGEGVPRWYSWNTTDEVFRQEPFPWRAPRDSLLEPIRQELSKTHQPTPRRELWDQNGNRVYYETMINRWTYEHIMSYELYTVNKLIDYAHYKPGYANRAFAGKVPPDSVVTMRPLRFGWGAEDGGVMGSSVLKLAWKIIDPGDDPLRFYTRDAYAVTEQDTVKHTFGLVGMHISYKNSDPKSQWYWATFEHIDNVPKRGPVVCTDRFPDVPEPRYENPLFNDPLCSKCPPNDTLRSEEGLLRTHVVRVDPIPEAIARLNCEVRALLYAEDPKGPASYYNLVGTQLQWKDEAERPVIYPNLLANTVLETYEQEKSGGCVGCHAGAPLPDVDLKTREIVYKRKCNPNETSCGDFIFMLSTRTHRELTKQDPR